MRTSYEIMVRISEITADPFRSELDNLALCLDYKHAIPFLKAGTTEAEWNLDKVSTSKESIIGCMQNYIKYAIEKAYSHRGLTATRSIFRFRGWLWLACDDELVVFAEDDSNYAPYGMPILKAICNKYNFEFPNDKEVVRMSLGQPCTENCEEGCQL